MSFNIEDYYIQDLKDIDSPSLVVYPDYVKQNIQTAIGFVGGTEQLRPHVKTHKNIETAKIHVELDIKKFKCATIAEAEMLALAGADDILIAYQPTSVKAQRILKLIKRYTKVKFSCLADNKETIQNLAAIFKDHIISIYLDINVGMNRTGANPSDISSLIDCCLSFANIKLEGIHAYDGHIHDTNLIIRRNEVEEVYQQLKCIKQDSLKDHQTHLKIVVGGTPTFHLYAQLDNDSEVSPGTYVYWDWDYAQLLPDLKFKFAAILISRVISIIDREHICIDAGHKSVASENPLPRIHFPEIDCVAVGHSEEHMVLKVKDSNKFEIGQILYGIPHHICPTVALYENIYVSNNNRIMESWQVIARRRSITI